MSITAEQIPYFLSEEENQKTFDSLILPEFFSDTVPAHKMIYGLSFPGKRGDKTELKSITRKPKAVFLGGQSGSGKTRLADFHRRQFTKAGGVVVVNSDELRTYHPQFPYLQQTQFKEASSLVNPDTIKWQQKLIRATSESGRNLILDGTLGGDPAPICQTMQQLREKGYVIQLSILAIPARLSRLGIYEQYEDQIQDKGQGCWVEMDNHDKLYAQIPQTITLLETEKVVDRIYIYGRFIGSISPLLHENWLENGEWHTPPRAAEALDESRNRPWSMAENNAYQAVSQLLKEKMVSRNAASEHRDGLDNQPEPIPLVYRPAQPADARLYFDWANDPVTRQQSFKTEPISWENHTTWFSRKLTDPNTLLLVFETQQQEPVGQVRLEQLGPEIIIGISLDSAFRGKGLAVNIIKAATEAASGHFPNATLPIHAYIRPDNPASIRSFEKAGFTFSHKSGKFGVQSVVYVYSSRPSYY